MSYLDDLVNAVKGVTSNPHEEAAMLFACGAESGCQPIQNRTGAPAYGPWQIYLPYHAGVSVAQANDPQYAADYMYNNMNVKSCAAQADWTDPHAAMLQAGRCIENASPLEQYSTAQKDEGWSFGDQYALDNAPSENGGSVANNSDQPNLDPKTGCRGGVGFVVAGALICPLGVSGNPLANPLPTSGSGLGITGSGNSGLIDSATQALGVLQDKQTWIRLGIFLIGVLLIIGGIHAFTGVSATV
jgi:hypothetical protein